MHTIPSSNAVTPLLRTIVATACLSLLSMTSAAQSWLTTESSVAPRQGSLFGSSVSTHADTSASSISTAPNISLVSSTINPTALNGVSLYYDADSGRFGKINDIGHGQSLVTEYGSNDSLTLINRYPDGRVSWRSILD